MRAMSALKKGLGSTKAFIMQMGKNYFAEYAM